MLLIIIRTLIEFLGVQNEVSCVWWQIRKLDNNYCSNSWCQWQSTEVWQRHLQCNGCNGGGSGNIEEQSEVPSDCEPQISSIWAEIWLFYNNLLFLYQDFDIYCILFTYTHAYMHTQMFGYNVSAGIHAHMDVYIQVCNTSSTC